LSRVNLFHGGKRADLVTCGIGVNDILYTSPAKLFTDLRARMVILVP
jgi:hypothetical protein